MKYIFQNEDIRLIIEEDPIGWYLLVYENKNDQNSTADYLQDTLEDAFAEAFELFGVTTDEWQKIS